MITTKIVVPGELPDTNTIIAAAKEHWTKYNSLKKN